MKRRRRSGLDNEPCGTPQPIFLFLWLDSNEIYVLEAIRVLAFEPFYKQSGEAIRLHFLPWDTMIQCNESIFYRSRKSVLTSDPFFFQRFSPVNSAIASMVLWFFRKPNCSQLKKRFNSRKFYILMWTTTSTILPNVRSGEIGLYFVNSSSDHFSNKGKTFATASCSRKTFVTNQ